MKKITCTIILVISLLVCIQNAEATPFIYNMSETLSNNTKDIHGWHGKTFNFRYTNDLVKMRHKINLDNYRLTTHVRYPYRYKSYRSQIPMPNYMSLFNRTNKSGDKIDLKNNIRNLSENNASEASHTPESSTMLLLGLGLFLLSVVGRNRLKRNI